MIEPKGEPIPFVGWVQEEAKEIDREQIVLWAMESGFPSNYVRGEVARFERFARLVELYVIDRAITLVKEH